MFTDHPIGVIYDRTIKDLVKPVIDGYNGTVFAYGATGTGKTFTMLGDQENRGLCSLTLEDIFVKISSGEYDDFNFKVAVGDIFLV